MRMIFIFTALMLSLSYGCVTANKGDLRLVDIPICVKGTQSIVKDSARYYKSSTKCEKYLNICQLQIRTEDGRWEMVVNASVPCDKTPPINLEGDADFDYTKLPPSKITER
jgi:hypothetical protein